MKSKSLTTAIKTTAHVNTVLLIVMLLLATSPAHSSSFTAPTLDSTNQPGHAISGTNHELALKDALGNWVNIENGLWSYGFYPTFAVMDGAFWDYESVTSRKGRLQIQLRHGEKRTTIYALPAKGLLKVGTDQKHLTAYARQTPANPDFKNYDQTGFKLPIIHADSFRLSGVIGGYDPKKDNFIYIQVIYNSIIENEQRSFVAQLDSLGRFSVTFPLLNPQDIMLRVGNGLTLLFASPGSNVLAYINKAPFDKLKTMDDYIAFIKTKPDQLFMGDEGILNTEINEYWPRRHNIFSPIESQQMTDSLGPLAYKEKRIEKMNELLADLEKYALSHHAGKKFVQQVNASIRYSAVDDLLRYRWLRGVDLSKEYLSFLTTISLTDEVVISTTNYFSVIHEYLSLLRDQKEKAISSQALKIEEVLEKAIDTHPEIPAEDKRILQRLADLQKHLDQPEIQQTLKKDSAVFQQVFARHSRLLQETAQALFSTRQNELKSSVQAHLTDSLPHGIGRDMALARMAIKHLEKQNILTPDQLSFYKANIQTSVFYDEIVRTNTDLTNKLEGKVPLNTELLSPLAASAKNVLESLVSKYKGSVVYVDFWAPWCGPCMGEMPHAKTLKKELAGKNVTFLYLCVNCTEESWTKTIKAKEIDGQHYRLNDNEYTLLSNLFKINGIPRYLLMNKEGVVVDENATRPSDSEALVKKITDLLD